MKQFLKEFIHNVIVHPLMMVLPTDKACILHDTNANWAFKERCDELYLEGYKEKEDISNKTILNNLYIDWINKEFNTPLNFEIKPTAAGYYLYSDHLNNVYKTVSRSRQLLNEDHVKIYQSFIKLKEIYN